MISNKVNENADRKYDVIVIGTGMGGATIGYYLSKYGKNVLFLERGLSHDSYSTAGVDLSKLENYNDRFNNGYWPDKIIHNREDSFLDLFAVAGCGSGGSTKLYASQLERFFKEDFSPRKNFPHITDTSLPDNWPITYDEMMPYYRVAESLYRVSGTIDPLNIDIDAKYFSSPKISQNDQYVIDSLESAGLHPYRAHVACDFLPGCSECVGKICTNECKNDSKKICLNPAVNLYGATVINECTVIRLETSGNLISSVVCQIDNQITSFVADIIVLAAGALNTPALLLKSKSEERPNGLSNSSGLVGRNLMWHASDFLAVKSYKFKSSVGVKKSLSFNDFYCDHSGKMGAVQSVGVPVNYEYVLTYVNRVILKLPKVVQPFIPNFICRIFAYLGGQFFKNAVLLNTVVEDLPYYHNRVYIDDSHPTKIFFEYKFTPELRVRCDNIIRKISESLSDYYIFRLSRRAESINFGHPCGTCRFGIDSSSSVLNQDCRSHDVENLYVCDASFFPSSGGTNPSLTIAANAIRVAEKILGHEIK
jgi:choline dehydrogenase-like flavoprotein